MIQKKQNRSNAINKNVIEKLALYDSLKPLINISKVMTQNCHYKTKGFLRKHTKCKNWTYTFWWHVYLVVFVQMGQSIKKLGTKKTSRILINKENNGK